MIEVVIIDPMDIDAPQPGGIEGYVRNLIPHLVDHRINVKLIGVSYNNVGLKTKRSDYDFVPIVQKNKISGYDFLLNLLLKTRLLKISKNSIIHSQRPDNMFPLTLFHKKNPKICTLHGFFNRGIYLKKGKAVGRTYDLIESFTLKRVNKIIAVNESTRDYYIKMYPWLKDKIVIIPVGIDTEKFKPMNKEKMRQNYGFNVNDKVVLYVGRLEKEKALDLLIYAFKEVKEKIKDAKLVIVGDGREKNRLKCLVDKLKLKEVRFTGTLEHNEIPEILNCADVFALTSLYESGPLVTQEAIACGIPVVTTDVGRVRDFIKNNLVGRVTDRNEKNFAVAIIEIFNSDQEKTRTACRKAAMDFSFEKTANMTIEIYKRLEKEH